VTTYLEHYHAERNHQSLDNRLIEPQPDSPAIAENIECRERLGGMLRYYHRKAA
jgi:putative transposase